MYRKGNFDNNKYNDLIYSLNMKRDYLIGDKIVNGVIKEIDHANLIISVSGEKKTFKAKEISYIF